MMLKNRNFRYQIYGAIFQMVCLAANVVALVFLGALLYSILENGSHQFDWSFLTSKQSKLNPGRSGIYYPLGGSITLMILIGVLAIPIAVGAAIYLEEYATNSRALRLIKLNIRNLAGVPSIIYGLLGLTVFVRGIQIFGIQIGLGEIMAAGALTMSLLILPVITIATQEALKAVPDSFRQAGYGIGMTRWQVVQHMTLPVALPGIMTGVILAISRAIGETAPLIVAGAVLSLTNPDFLFNGALEPLISPGAAYTVLPLKIYFWTSEPQKIWHENAGAAIIVLMAFMLIMNAVAVALRIHFRKKLKHMNN